MHCCGEPRPGPGPVVEIRAQQGHFVTIGGFVDIVDPWLRGLDEQLRAAAGVVDSWPLDPAYGFVVRAWTCPIRVANTKGWTLENFAYERRLQAKIARKTLEGLREVDV